jgi:adenine-specific DNA-methyltransferase
MTKFFVKDFGSVSPKNVETFGQVFTPKVIVDFMKAGVWNHEGRILEPSCGDGAFLRFLPDGALGLEIDRAHCPRNAINIDFFAYPDTEKFDCIIGNPPYVRYQDIPSATKALLRKEHFDGRSNLYLFFIEKAIRHLNDGGELVFITPRDFLKATSAVGLNRWLHEHGTITHAVELGDAKIFDGAVPNCLIWRYERGNKSHRTWVASIGYGESLEALPPHWNLSWQQKHFVESAGHLSFTETNSSLCIADIGFVKVGAVSGADDVYTDSVFGTRDFVCSVTAKTNEFRKMIWCEPGERPPSSLLKHKDRLIARRIRQFDESNWWLWGRSYYQSTRPRIYVNSKTRNRQPFFLAQCDHYDGSVLAFFPHDISVDLTALCEALNAVDWEEQGFVCDGRYLFSQRSLQQAALPETFLKFQPNK